MNRYEKTSIWQKTLGRQLNNDDYENERDFLRNSYEQFRERARLLAGEINRSLPEYTVHDITHIDALWDMAELITKDKVSLNPIEAFVLGGAFLIHDLGMGIAAYPEGIEQIKKEKMWRDIAASLFREKYNRTISNTDYDSLDNEIEKNTTETVLRQLHAQ